MLLSKLSRPACSKLIDLSSNLCRKSGLGVVTKRWSGHNAMEITPSSFDFQYGKNALHFWTVISGVPMIVITVIINTRANPELSEIPEGYQPRHWEYYKHPVARFMARHFFTPVELDHETTLSMYERLSETEIIKSIHRHVKKTMRFYNDHRSGHFLPFYGENVRISRDTVQNKFLINITKEGDVIDAAYDPKQNVVAPTEGMHIPIEK